MYLSNSALIAILQNAHLSTITLATGTAIPTMIPVSGYTALFTVTLEFSIVPGKSD